MKTWVIVIIVMAVLGVVGATVTGILAAIAVPQFTGASQEAKVSALSGDLQKVRCMIKLYKEQHNDNLPGVVGKATFRQAMTERTDINGDRGSVYGPYLQRIPKNCFNDLDTVDVSGMGVIGDDSHGWDFNPMTGHFNADDSAEHKRWTQENGN